MSDISIDDDEIRDDADESGNGEDAKASGAAFLSKLPLAKVGGVLILLVAAVGAVGLGLFASLGPDETSAYIGQFVSGESAKEQAAAKQDTLAADKPVYIRMEELLVNLPNDAGLELLKTRIVLKVQPTSSLTVQEREPELIDMLQNFLRQLDSTDLRGSMGIFRIKNEILRRANLLFDGNPVLEVLLVEMIAQ